MYISQQILVGYLRPHCLTEHQVITSGASHFKLSGGKTNFCDVELKFLKESNCHI